MQEIEICPNMWREMKAGAIATGVAFVAHPSLAKDWTVSDAKRRAIMSFFFTEE